MELADDTGTKEMKGFDKFGKQLFGVGAKELHDLKENNIAEFQNMIDKVLFENHIFKIKVKEETYQGITEVKCTAIKLQE